jgi:hypothetical protein
MDPTPSQLNPFYTPILFALDPSDVSFARVCLASGLFPSRFATETVQLCIGPILNFPSVLCVLHALSISLGLFRPP